MFAETINTDEAIDLFHQIMQSPNKIRILRLVGDAKMGKSHLLTKIFPALVQQQYHARCAVLDLRNRMFTIPDILNMACNLLDVKNFDGFYAAHREWSNRLHVKAEKVYAIASSLKIIGGGGSDEAQARDRELTTQFVKDLVKINDRSLLLLFDSVNEATESMQMWLMDTFLVSVSQLPHVRVIIAGRTLPGANGTYTLLCKSHRLQAITEVEEYITYCQKLNATLGEQSIRDFAYACDYIPGMFVDLVYPKFIK